MLFSGVVRSAHYATEVLQKLTGFRILTSFSK